MRRIGVLLWMCVVTVGLTTAVVTPAEAQVRTGAQGGISIDPDQFYFGGHVETTPLVNRLRFRPSVDIGIGEDVVAVAGNFDFTYTFPGGRQWNLYVGGGPAVNFYNADNGGDNTEGGFNFLIGAKQNRGLFFEMKVGVEGSPDVKFGVGYTFR